MQNIYSVFATQAIYIHADILIQYVGRGLTETKAKPSSWGFAELGNNNKNSGRYLRSAHALRSGQMFISGALDLTFNIIFCLPISEWVVL